MSTERKVYTLTFDLIDDSPDGAEAANLAQLEASFLRIVREHRASAGMAQLQVVSCVEED
jgi:hypothetical protein